MFKNLFKRKNKSVTPAIQDYIDPETGELTKSSVVYDKNNTRFLKLDNASCAMIMHPNGKIEVVFTKLYDEEKQQVTIEEETLMSIAMFMRQPGFAELLRKEFHNIAMKNISTFNEGQ